MMTEIEKALVASEEVEDFLLRNNLGYFAEKILDMEIVGHHRDWSKLASLHKRVGINASRDHGKTTSLRNTLILKSDGSRKKFDELEVGEEVFSLNDEYRVSKNKVLAKQNCGKKECVKIITKSGREIEAAYTHPFRKLEGWTVTEDLRVGDRIATPRNIPLDLPEYPVSDEEIKLLGHVVANGSVTRGFDISSKAHKTEIEEILSRLGWKFYSRPVRRGHLISIKNKSWVEAHGLAGSKSKDKFTPSLVFKLSNRQLKLYLSRLWTDGSISIQKNTTRGEVVGKQIGIELCLSNKSLIKDVQHLLLRLGILSQFKRRVSKCKGKEFDSYRLNVTGKDNQIKFLKEIGVIQSREKCNEAISHLQTLKTNSQSDLIPKHVYKLFNKSSHWHKERGVPVVYDYNINRHKLLKAGENEKNKTLIDIATSEVYWDEIESITPIGVQECWDIEVENDHNYIANDIFSHNSFFWCFAYMIWRAYYRWIPDDLDSSFKSIPRIPMGYVFSNTQDQAIKHLALIKAEIESNPKLQHLIPDKREVWAKQEIKLSNGSIIRARGWSVGIRGAHPTHIVADDVLSEECIYSELTRKKEKDYLFSAVTPMLIPGGQLIVVGTPLHVEDLYADLERNPQYIFKKFPAWNDKEIPLWPTRYSKELLLSRREEVGNSRFAREYLCVAIDNESSLFPDTIIEPCFDPQFEMPTYFSPEDHRELQVYTGIDLAMSATVGADYTVILTIGVDKYKNKWILEIKRFKGKGMTDQLREIEDVYRRFNPKKMFIEDNNFQRVFKDELVRRTDMPVQGFTTSRYNKNDMEKGVPSLQIQFENKKFVIARKTERDRRITDVLCHELRAFTFVDGKLQGLGAHDDTVMALWLATEAARTSSFTFSFT